MPERQVHDTDVVLGPELDHPVERRKDVGRRTAAVGVERPDRDQVSVGGEPPEGTIVGVAGRVGAVAVDDSRHVRAVAVIVGQTGLVPDHLDLDDL